jgi:hypothetical protein
MELIANNVPSWKSLPCRVLVHVKLVVPEAKLVQRVGLTMCNQRAFFVRLENFLQTKENVNHALQDRWQLALVAQNVFLVSADLRLKAVLHVFLAQ